ncbi:Ubiquitin carboxyl-terminal hydrolase 22 [Dirofilaria immitis]|nr:Ubiquitin carboxyl-terminal hydrolase 22 [Dirofilaria immitis]
MNSPCKHIDKNRRILSKNLNEVVYAVIFPNNSKSREVHARYIRCIQCKTRLNALMCACCQCSTFACLTHMHDHLSTKEHLFAISVETGFIYCYQCGDFVYNREMEDARRDAENGCRRSLNLSTRSIWYPGAAVVAVCHDDPTRMVRFSKSSIRGLRGLVNLGNTCFMNCIIQAIVHTPHLKDYFLTDQHHCASSSSHSKAQCLMCELANTFQEFYKGDVTPYKPNRFLNLVWTHARHLAGYEQQDAHEFFIAALDVLHRHSGSSSLPSTPNECNCIIDWIFTGKLQSDLTCSICGCVSTTVDPFWDISLDVAQEVLRSPSSSSGLPQQITLEDCLHRYIMPEHLGSNAKTKCARCETYEESTKQLTLKTLPMVACFHLKRFEHSHNDRKKMDTKIKYPQFIDMTPFTASFRERSTGVPDSKTSIVTDLLITNRNKYELFAVVNHLGTMESGHYTCYIRHQRNQWFQCDDQKVTKYPRNESSLPKATYCFIINVMLIIINQGSD